ncbi:MAG: hypothetical protein AAFV29_18765, partial [Myxococcota bacterium]
MHADGQRVAAIDAENRLQTWSDGQSSARVGPRLSPSVEKMAWVGDSVVVAASDGFAEVGLNGGPPRSISCGDDTRVVLGRAIDAASGRVVASTANDITICATAGGTPISRSVPGLAAESHQLSLFEGGVLVKPASKRPLLVEMQRNRPTSLSMREARDWTHVVASSSGDVVAAWLARSRTIATLHFGPRRRRSTEVGRVLHADRLLAAVSVDADHRHIATTWRSGRYSGGAEIYDAKSGQRVCSVSRMNEDRRPILRGGGQVLELHRLRGRSSTLYDGDCQRRAAISNGWVSPSGRWVVVRKGKQVLVRSAFDRAVMSTFRCGLSSLTAAAFSADEKRVVATDVKSVCFIDRTTGAVERQPYQVRFDGWLIDGPQDAAVSADGQTVFLVDEIGVLDRWGWGRARQSFDGPAYFRRQHPNGLPKVLWPSDAGYAAGRSLFTLGGDGDLTRWAVES